MNTYHLQRGAESNGPYEESQLVDLWEGGQLTPDTLVRPDADTEWHPAPKIMALIAERKRGEEQQDRWRQQRLAYTALSSSQFQRDKHSPIMAALMSVVLPGAGHFYCGAPFMGVLWLLAAAVAVGGLLRGGITGSTVFLVYGVLGLASAFLAYITTERLNRKLRTSLQL